MQGSGQRLRACCSHAPYRAGAGGRFASPLRICLAFAFLTQLLGCSARTEIHPGLQLNSKQMSAAKERGRRLIQGCMDPYRAYGSPREEVNTRVSADVIFRQAIACWPINEVAFEVACQGDASENAVRRAAIEAQRRTERELKFLVILQMPQSRDPAEIQFVMRSNRGTEYPPLAVQTPTKLRDILVGLDPNMPPSALYRYEVRFPLTGSPGYPPIDKMVSSVGVVVRDGGSEGEQWFSLPHRPM